jgi:hypothetical protein
MGKAFNTCAPKDLALKESMPRESMPRESILVGQWSPIRATRPALTGERNSSLGGSVRELAQLNLQYLCLPSAESQLPDGIATRVHALSDAARWAMADCLFSLFTVRFEDRERWLTLLAAATKQLTCPKVLEVSTNTRSEFAATAIVFAWHLAQSNPLAARVLLDMDWEIASALREVSVLRLRVVAAHSVEWLAPRWPQNSHFWPTLVGHADEPFGVGLRAVKLLGRQILAAEAVAFPPNLVVNPHPAQAPGTRHRRIARKHGLASH